MDSKKGDGEIGRSGSINPSGDARTKPLHLIAIGSLEALWILVGVVGGRKGMINKKTKTCPRDLWCWRRERQQWRQNSIYLRVTHAIIIVHVKSNSFPSYDPEQRRMMTQMTSASFSPPHFFSFISEERRRRHHLIRNKWNRNWKKKKEKNTSLSFTISWKSIAIQLNRRFSPHPGG